MTSATLGTMTRQQQLTESAAMVGFRYATYSPGDGVTRYRFFTLDDDSSYFGPSNGVGTALGIREAESFVRGVMVGRWHSA